MKLLLRSLLLCGLLLATALLLAVTTELGSRTVFKILQQVAPVEVDYGSGRLSGRLSLKRLRFKTDEVQIELTDLVTEFAPGCLLRTAICLRKLQIGELNIALLESSEPIHALKQDLENNNVAELLAFPAAIEIDSLDLAALRVNWSGGEWQQGATQGRVHISGSVIQVFTGVIMASQLVLPKTADQDVVSSDHTVLPPIDLPFGLLVDELKLLEPAWDLYGAQYRQDSIVLAGRWLNHFLSLTRLDVNNRDIGVLAMHGDVAFEADWPLHASVNIDLAQPSARPELFGQRLTLTAHGNLASLALQLTSAGNINTVVDAEVNVLSADLPFSAALIATSGANLSLADVDGVPDAFADVELEFPVVMSGSGTLFSQAFELQTAATGKGYESLAFSLQGSHQSGKVVIDELSMLDVAGNNALDASGEIVLADAIEWSIALQSDGVDLPHDMEALGGRMEGALHLTGKVQAPRWEVSVRDVQLEGTINGLPAYIRGFAGINSEMRLLSSELDAELNGAEASLRAGGKRQGMGQVALSIDDMGRWQAGNRGQIQLALLIAPDAKHFELSGNIQNIVWRELTLETGAVSGEYWMDKEQAFMLELAFEDVVLGAIEQSSLSLSAQGDNARQTISVLSSGDVGGELVLTGTRTEDRWRGIVGPTQLQTGVGVWQLSAPVQLLWSDAAGQLSLDAHCWLNSYAKVCSDNWLLGASGRGAIDMSGDIKLFSPLLSPRLDIQGAMELEVEASWAEGGHIVAKGQGQAVDLIVTREINKEQSAVVGWETGAASFTYDSDGLQLDVGLQHAGREIADLNLQLSAGKDAAVAGAVRFDHLQLTTFTPLIPSLSALSGEVTGELSLSGTIDQPTGDGSLRLSNGQLVMANNPTEIDRLNLTLDVLGDRAEVRGSALLGGGEMTLSGELRARPNLSLLLSVDGQNNTILYPPSTELTVSESLELRLTNDLLAIAGEVTVDKGSVQIEELPQDSVSISTSVVEVDYAGNVLQQKLPFETSMNVKIVIKDKFKVSGSLFKTTLGGDLSARQRPGHPLELFGNLRTIGGEMSAFQSHLKIRRGTLNFSGPPASPSLDLRAERDITAGNITVGVHVQGSLGEDLELDVYSDPVMSQPNAMSYLLRGRAMDVGAESDGAALALSLASGVVNRSSLVSDLNSIPGVNNIAFGAEGSESDTAATLSGYIGNRIYLSYGVGFYEPINVLTARFYFRSRIWLEIVSSLENSVDLYYSFDIE